MIKCIIENINFTIINVYCPTKDQFLQNLKDIIDEHSDEKIFLGGDFNTYLDPMMDKKCGVIEKQTLYAEKLISLCEEYSLADMWRVRNPKQTKFTRRENSKNGYMGDPGVF